MKKLTSCGLAKAGEKSHQEDELQKDISDSATAPACAKSLLAKVIGSCLQWFSFKIRSKQRSVSGNNKINNDKLFDLSSKESKSHQEFRQYTEQTSSLLNSIVLIDS